MKKKLFAGISLLFTILTAPLAAQNSQEIVIPMIKSPYPVKTVGWSKDGYKFAYPEDRRVLIRRATDYALLQTIYTANGSIDFIHFPQETMGEDYDQLATLSKNNILETRILPNNNVINSVKFNPETGSTVLTASRNGNYIATGSGDGIINLFLQNYMTKTLIQYPLKGEETGPVKYIDFSPDNKKLIAVYKNDMGLIWDVASKKIVARIPYMSSFDVPIIFNSDSKSFFSANAKRTIGMYDLEGNEIKKITAKAQVKSITLSADGKHLIVLATNNMFYFYNIETAKLEKYVPAFNKTPLTAYAFTNSNKKLLIGHEDGTIYVIRMEDFLLNPGEKPPKYRFEDMSNKKAPDDKEDPEEKKQSQKELSENQNQNNNQYNQNQSGNGNQGGGGEANQNQQSKQTQVKTESKVANSVVRRLLFPDMDPHSKTEHEIVIDLGVGTSIAPYNLSFSVETGYLNHGLLFPFYFGGMLKPTLAIAFTEYPYTYTNVETGDVLSNPFLTGGKIFVPIGFTFFPFSSDFEMFTQIQLGASFNLIWNGNIGSKGITSKVYPSFYGGLKIGAGYRYFQIAICEEYEVLTGFSFSGELGVRFGF
ncbi:MAG: WD40 repeat domain-containing protein [Treponema sp.]|nr:WD40 repeat domain-containing protein [Treponema sp.]